MLKILVAGLVAIVFAGLSAFAAQFGANIPVTVAAGVGFVVGLILG